MAAFETPWLTEMATPKPIRDDSASSLLGTDDHTLPSTAPSGAPPTYASFSPVTLSASTPSRSSRQSTILVHQKSPLLLATPPQITRALAYSHPFLLPLNKAAGLLTWTTGDPWESFLVLCAFWAVVLYGDVILRFAGPIVLVLSLMLAMYSRRYSPLSSSGWTEPASKEGGTTGDSSHGSHANHTSGKGKAGGAGGGAGSGGGGGGHQRTPSEATNTRHRKTLDEMVETLKEFTGRCNVLLGPALEMTDFLSTQRTPTSATTRPALTALFVRILFCTPFWYALTLPPLRIVTTRRVVLLIGTLVLTWHARVMRVARTILWRSATLRHAAALVTGLQFEKPTKGGQGQGKGQSEGGSDVVTKSMEQSSPKSVRRTDSELTRALRRRSHRHGNNATGRDAGVKFTFIIYENQRRWVGLGWTQSLFAYERAAWTDEHNNPVPAKGGFELPEVEDGSRMRWRWVEGSRWRVDGVADEGDKEVDYDGEGGKNGWIYYDNKWQNGRRGADGWGKWTRRRKWYRDAELVEVSEEDYFQAESQRRAGGVDSGGPPAAASAPDLTTQRYSTVSEKMVSPTTLGPSQSGTDGAGDGKSDFPPTSSSSPPNAAAASSTSALSTSSGSTSGRSFFRKPLMRRPTNQSTASAATSTTAVEGADGTKGQRRPSESRSKSDDEAEGDELGLRVNLALQGQGGGGGGWGIGDEARMNLE